MATRKHQFILGLVVKKLQEFGYKIAALDGAYPGMFGEGLPNPPIIQRHRPDIMGVKKDGQICIGEAKTKEDIETQRTFEQLQDFASLELNGRICEVFIGVPRSSESSFRKVLERIGLDSVGNVHPLFIPDEIINE